MSAVMDMQQFIYILGEFHKLYPNVTYNLNESGGKSIETRLINDQIDIGITTIPIDENVFDYLPLYSEDLRLVVSKEHDLASRDSVTMAELKNEDFILFNEDFTLMIKLLPQLKMQDFSQIRFQMSRNGILLSICCGTFRCKYLTRAHR